MDPYQGYRDSDPTPTLDRDPDQTAMLDPAGVFDTEVRIRIQLEFQYSDFNLDHGTYIKW